MRPKELPKGNRASHASPAGLDKSPMFAEFMTSAAFEDGTARMSPTVTIWCQGGEWKANIRDRAEKVCLWLSEESFPKLLKLLEEMCQESAAPWRVDDREDERNGKRLPRKG